MSSTLSFVLFDNVIHRAQSAKDKGAQHPKRTLEPSKTKELLKCFREERKQSNGAYLRCVSHHSRAFWNSFSHGPGSVGFKPRS